MGNALYISMDLWYQGELSRTCSGHMGSIWRMSWAKWPKVSIENGYEGPKMNMSWV
ncbi:WD40 repeat [Sesbania bispinosa]|nr:WD40 repeat [Sesbania bispinosa]